MLKPKQCLICSVFFQPTTSLNKVCKRKSCRVEFERRKNEERTRKKFSYGTVFMLNMSLPPSEWTWVKDERGDKDV